MYSSIQSVNRKQRQEVPESEALHNKPDEDLLGMLGKQGKWECENCITFWWVTSNPYETVLYITTGKLTVEAYTQMFYRWALNHLSNSKITFASINKVCIEYKLYWAFIPLSFSPANKATMHQVTTMLATSKNVLFPGHNHLLTTGTGDPSQSVRSSVLVLITWS